ncbi:MAG: NAD(P)-dependent oxidoreductase [Calothrix sp. C42_A2020_038]|nr:NAD(P)-dependent oxidoreductase [Calothrix sp. C42_A2020_038]
MKKLLITGASGFLGWHIIQAGCKDYEVYGTYNSHALEVNGASLFKANLSDFQELKQIFTTIKPDAVIHTAALSQPNYCQNHPEESHAINVIASANIAGLCADYSIPCAFTSTDLVFDGKNAPYKETDTVKPVNLYGEQKVLAEQAMLERYEYTVVCRMPLMFGTATPTAKSFMQGFIQTLQEGKELKLFTDEFRTPISGTTAAQGLLLMIEKKYHGIIHLGGKERISRYDFGKLMVEVFKLPDTNLKSCQQKDVIMSAPRPADVSFDSTKAFSLGYKPLLVKEELEAITSVVI